MPAYDLRTTAKTAGNRPYLPPQYAVLVHIGYAIIGLALLATLVFVCWGYYIDSQLKESRGKIAGYHEKIGSYDQLLWLADWRNKSLPIQEILVRFFASLDKDISLSQLQFTHFPEQQVVEMRIAINSDKNTSAQYFREISSFLQSEGLSMLSIEQNQVVGATVFVAKLKILKAVSKPLMSANAAVESNGAIVSTPQSL
jgi:hypothetical protein